MSLLAKFFGKEKELEPAALAKPFRERAKQAVLREDWPKAVALLDRGISLAPDRLDLYLERAHILQYGLKDYSRALRDYRHILQILEHQPDHELAKLCKRAMKDMMAEQPG